MTLAEILAEVYTLTNRPDLTAVSLSAVRSATLLLHQADFWTRDIAETGVSFSTAEYEQDFEVTTFLPLFRAIKYARVWDNDAEEPLQFFTIIDPQNVLDSYNQARKDVCYLGGSEIHFKCADEFQHILFGYYANPVVTEAGYSSWIATEHPYAIVFKAASIVFKSIGKTDEFRAFDQLAGEQLQIIRQSNILAQGQ